MATAPSTSPRRPEPGFVVRHVRLHQAKRAWTNDELARRMTTAGCPMDDSTLSKIKKGRRQVRLDELVAFAEVFETSLETLVRPLEAALADDLAEAVEALHEARTALLQQTAAVVPVINKALLLVLEGGKFTGRVASAVKRQHDAMLNMIDVFLEVEAALRDDDPADYPDSSELFPSKD